MFFGKNTAYTYTCTQGYTLGNTHAHIRQIDIDNIYVCVCVLCMYVCMGVNLKMYNNDTVNCDVSISVHEH